MTLLIQRKIANDHRNLVPTLAGGRIGRILRKWASRYDGELKRHRQELEAATRTKDEETRAELEKEVDREREEIERIKHNSERMAKDFNTEKSRLQSRIIELENENHRYVEELEGLRDQVFQAREEAETLQIEHRRRETELLQKKEAEERKAHQLEEECNAGKLAEARYQEYLSELQQQILRVEAEKKWVETEYDANVRAERERALTLDMELQRQAKVKEEEERARLLEEERQGLVCGTQLGELDKKWKILSLNRNGANAWPCLQAKARSKPRRFLSRSRVKSSGMRRKDARGKFSRRRSAYVIPWRKLTSRKNRRLKLIGK